MAAEVSNRSSAPTEQELLASYKQPDGACAPPSAQNKKNPPQETKREQPTRTAEPTHTPAQGKTDTGGETRGASDKQIKFLQVLADKVGAEPAEELWRAADPKRLQAQIKAAIPFKDLKVKHTHAACEEAVMLVWNDENDDLGASKHCVQRCICGAARSVYISEVAGVANLGLSHLHDGWKLHGHIVNYEIYSSDLAVTVSDEVQKDHDTGEDRIVDLTGRWRDRQMPMSTVAAMIQSLPKYGDSENYWIDAVVPVDRLDG